MATRRAEKPYIWVTWLSKLLGGDLECVWAAWFKAHYRYEKHEEMAGDLSKWNADHTALMRKREAQLTNQGYRCTTEKQNEFKLEGSVAIVAGKPDLLAIHGGTASVPAHAIAVDGKTGARRNGDWWQVLIYLYALPLARRQAKQPTPGELSGEIYYAKGSESVTIESSELTETRKGELVAMIQAIAGDVAPAKKPSREECKRCNIGPADCPERVLPKATKTTKTNDF